MNMHDECCPLCNGDDAVFMGLLGSLAWYRCRYCGIEFNALFSGEEEEE
jgi:rubredoxin